jgi:hypothetical protein
MFVGLSSLHPVPQTAAVDVIPLASRPFLPILEFREVALVCLHDLGLATRRGFVQGNVVSLVLIAYENRRMR